MVRTTPRTVVMTTPRTGIELTQSLSDQLYSVSGGTSLKMAKKKRKPVKPRLKSAIGGWLNKLKVDNCPIRESVRHDFM